MKFVRDTVGENKLMKELAERRLWPETLPTPQVFRSDTGCIALLSRHPFGNTLDGEIRWHISLEGPDRLPTWDEMAEAAHALRPGVGFVIGVPPRSLWMNLADNVLHLWETKDAGLEAEWRANARGDQRT